jgi:acyl-CoA synthetase (AMP-forming)/AMP-acid ligase II
MTEFPARPFWLDLDRFDDRPALVSCPELRAVSYRQLAKAVGACAEQLRRRDKALVLLLTQTRSDVVVGLLSGLAAGHCVYLANPATPLSALRRLIDLYRPDLVVGEEQALAESGAAGDFAPLHGALSVWDRGRTRADDIHPDLALLLSTSGSTGSPKTVRLSWRNLAVNARQIAMALAIRGTDTAVLSLPLAYTYGLSVLTSHLSAGARLVVDDRSCLDPGFWESAAEVGVTSFPGVSFTLDFLRRHGDQVMPATLRVITHSGSRLDVPTIEWLRRTRAETGLDIFKMYGMTEATARLAVLPPNEFDLHPESVGYAVDGGGFTLSAQGEVLYRGPNVMMGYAVKREDLREGDCQHGALATGDLGCLDAAGRLTLTGRLGRLAKIMALRLDLSEIEDFFGEVAPVAVTCDDDILYVHHADCEGDLAPLVDRFCAEYRLPRSKIALRPRKGLPRGAGGKILYGELRA